MLKLIVPQHVILYIPAENAEKTMRKLLEKYGFDKSKEIISWCNPSTMDYEYTQGDTSTTDKISVVDVKDVLFLGNEYLGTFVTNPDGGN